MEPAFPQEGKYLAGHVGGQMLDEPEPDKDPWDSVRQADHLAECVWLNREPKTPGEEGLRDRVVMSQIDQSAGLKAVKSAAAARRVRRTASTRRRWPCRPTGPSITTGGPAGRCGRS
jgi:hypothetical protein